MDSSHTNYRPCFEAETYLPEVSLADSRPRFWTDSGLTFGQDESLFSIVKARGGRGLGFTSRSFPGHSSIPSQVTA